MPQINGIEIVSAPILPALTPVLQLRHTIILTNKFREDFDKYLLDLFGEKPFILAIGRKIYANPIVINSIKQAINKKTPALFHA